MSILVVSSPLDTETLTFVDIFLVPEALFRYREALFRYHEALFRYREALFRYLEALFRYREALFRYREAKTLSSAHLWKSLLFIR